MGKKKETFEAALGRLEKIAQSLEDGELPLEKALKRYEDGVAAYRYCASLLEDAERKISILTEGGDKGLSGEDAADLEVSS